MALFFGHALPYMATNNDGNLYAELLPASQRVEAASGTQEIADGCLDSRVVDLRSRVEEQLNANLLFNSSMAGATGSVLPTNWASGSVSGLTYTISSASAVAGFQAIEWTVSGTALSDGDIYLACEPMQSGSVVAQIPSEYVGSMYCAKVSGTIKAAMVLQTLTQNFVDGAVQETKTKDLAAVTGTTFVRIEPNSVKTDIDLENRVNLRLYQPIASGEAVDFTIRVAAPQVEAGFAASPFISTVSGAVSEVRGRPSILVVPQLTKAGVVYPQIPVVSGADFTFTRDTTATRVNASGLIESVASGVLRLDYPIGGGCPAALIEPAGTNLLLRSEEFNDAYWTKNNSTISANATASPDGATTADKIVAVSGTVNANVARQNITISATAQTISVFLKQGEFTWSRVRIFDRRNNTGYSLFINLATGELGAIPAGATAAISIAANGFYRVQLSIPAVVGGTTECDVFIGSASSDGVVDVSGDGVKGIFAWGAQIETGAIPTSYIPTTTASATRNADVCSVSGVSGYIGQTQGTIYAEVEISRFAVNNRILAISDGTSDARVILQKAANSVIQGIVTTASASVVSISTASGQTAGVYKIALAYKTDDFAMYVNGTQIGTDTSGSVPACSQIFLGKIETSATTIQLNDLLRAAAIYTTRLTNDQLASLTRLT